MIVLVKMLNLNWLPLLFLQYDLVHMHEEIFYNDIIDKQKFVSEEKAQKRAFQYNYLIDIKFQN